MYHWCITRPAHTSCPLHPTTLTSLRNESSLMKHNTSKSHICVNYQRQFRICVCRPRNGAEQRLENVTFYIHYSARQKCPSCVVVIYTKRVLSALQFRNRAALGAEVSDRQCDIDTQYSFDISKLLTRISSINLYRKFLYLHLS